MLTIPERVKCTRFKTVYSFLESPLPQLNSFFRFFENCRTSRSSLLLIMDRFSTKRAKRSLKFQSVKLWNALSKEWTLGDSLLKFKVKVFDFLAKERMSIWVNL